MAPAARASGGRRRAPPGVRRPPLVRRRRRPGGQSGRDRDDADRELHQPRGGELDQVETATTLIENSTSLGGVSSRIDARARWEGDRVPPGLLRLSVGLEDADELWADLERALDGAS